ncbi:hypothetical protein HRbin39_00395 [bacterium HR39]|nr:hypothetical protein HRbin39_00395 [bacterium HR39]
MPPSAPPRVPGGWQVSRCAPRSLRPLRRPRGRVASRGGGSAGRRPFGVRQGRAVIRSRRVDGRAEDPAGHAPRRMDRPGSYAQGTIGTTSVRPSVPDDARRGPTRPRTDAPGRRSTIHGIGGRTAISRRVDDGGRGEMRGRGATVADVAAARAREEETIAKAAPVTSSWPPVARPEGPVRHEDVAERRVRSAVPGRDGDPRRRLRSASACGCPGRVPAKDDAVRTWGRDVASGRRARSSEPPHPARTSPRGRSWWTRRATRARADRDHAADSGERGHRAGARASHLRKGRCRIRSGDRIGEGDARARRGGAWQERTCRPGSRWKRGERRSGGPSVFPIDAGAGGPPAHAVP